MKTYCARAISFCLLVFLVSGCYTQIRSPLERRVAELPSGEVPDVVVQRFEHYHHYSRPDIYDPYSYFGGVPYYDSYGGWPYTRHINWYRHSLAWEQACWLSVYDRNWQWYSPAVLVPYVVHRYPVTVHDIEAPAAVRQRPQVRQGLSGGPVSASDIRQAPQVNTPPSTQSPPRVTTPNSDTSSSNKQATEKKKEEDKEETRSEKRSERKRRGGMR